MQFGNEQADTELNHVKLYVSGPVIPSLGFYIEQQVAVFTMRKEWKVRRELRSQI